ncbi:hypothetical protein D3C85_1382030 [compost metagenome]
MLSSGRKVGTTAAAGALPCSSSPSWLRELRNRKAAAATTTSTTTMAPIRTSLLLAGSLAGAAAAGGLADTLGFLAIQKPPDAGAGSAYRCAYY